MIGSPSERVKMQVGEQEIGRIAAEHDERAMRQIDDIEHAPDQRHAERHDPVQPALQHAVDEDLREQQSNLMTCAGGQA